MRLCANEVNDAIILFFQKETNRKISQQDAGRILTRKLDKAFIPQHPIHHGRQAKQPGGRCPSILGYIWAHDQRAEGRRHIFLSKGEADVSTSLYSHTRLRAPSMTMHVTTIPLHG